MFKYLQIHNLQDRQTKLVWSITKSKTPNSHAVEIFIYRFKFICLKCLHMTKIQVLKKVIFSSLA